MGELQEILRTTWHLIRQTEEQCNDHDDVVDEEQSTRMRGGGGDDDLPDAEMDAQLYEKMAHSYDSSKKRKYSHSVSGLPAFLSRPEDEPENSQSSGSRPSNRLQIPDVSDNVPHQVGKSEGESTTDDDDYIQDETLQCERSEIKWLETNLNVYHSIFIIKRMTGLYREFLLQSRGECHINVRCCPLFSFFDSRLLYLSFTGYILPHRASVCALRQISDKV